MVIYLNDEYVSKIYMYIYIYIYICNYLIPNPHAGYDTRSILSGITEPNGVWLQITVLVMAVRDYYICFQVFALSIPSVPKLCLKDPRRGLTEFNRIFFWRSGNMSG